MIALFACSVFVSLMIGMWIGRQEGAHAEREAMSSEISELESSNMYLRSHSNTCSQTIESLEKEIERLRG